MPNSIVYSAKFANNSDAKGMLLIFLYTGTGTSGPDFNRSIYLVHNKSDASRVQRLAQVSGGKYTALAYDIEGGGLITSTVPAARLQFDVYGYLTKGNLEQ